MFRTAVGLDFASLYGVAMLGIVRNADRFSREKWKPPNGDSNHHTIPGGNTSIISSATVDSDSLLGSGTSLIAAMGGSILCGITCWCRAPSDSAPRDLIEPGTSK